MKRLVVLHGALGSAHQFEPLRAALPGVDVHVLEFHGHGSAPDVADPWTIDLFAHQLEDLLENFHEDLHEDPHKVLSVFGYSMGGYVAIRLAQRRPDLISRILTLGTKLDWSPEGAAKEIKMLNADVIEQKVPAFAADLQRRHGSDHWRTVLTKTAELMVDLGAQPVLTEQNVADLTVPVRFGIGDRDEMVTLEETIRFYRATPQAQLTVLPGTRHPIEKVNLDLLIPEIERFLLA